MSVRFLAAAIIIVMTTALVCYGPHFAFASSATASSENTLSYPAGLIAIPSDSNFSDYTFIADKTERRLSVYKNVNDLPQKVTEHPTDIGKNNGPKEKANDFKTPVGIYFLLKELTQPEIPFDLYGQFAFVTDYPNIFDQRQAKTGNGIWLHAVPDSIPLTRGSRGCVVVRNDVIRDLKHLVKSEQTPMLIYEKVQYVSEKEYRQQRFSFLANFEKWRSAWEAYDVDTYIKFYDESFRNADMNYRQWYRHKKKLKERYTFMKVQLGPPLILKNEDQVVIRTLQRYESDQHKDYGEKTIHARLNPETGFKIIREDWRPLPDPQSITIDPTKEVQRSATNSTHK